MINSIDDMRTDIVRTVGKLCAAAGVEVRLSPAATL